jgi:hypothetical protein
MLAFRFTDPSHRQIQCVQKPDHVLDWDAGREQAACITVLESDDRFEPAKSLKAKFKPTQAEEAYLKARRPKPLPFVERYCIRQTSFSPPLWELSSWDVRQRRWDMLSVWPSLATAEAALRGAVLGATAPLTDPPRYYDGAGKMIGSGTWETHSEEAKLRPWV